MARAKKTPADELAEVQARIDALVAEGEALSGRQGDAEAMIRSYSSRRDDALTLRALGEAPELPDEAEQARLQRFVADAKVEHEAIRRARQRLEDQRGQVIAAGLPHFDAEAEEAARAYEALGEALLVALADFQAGGQAKGAAWGCSREGRKELGRESLPGVGHHDLGHLRGEIAEAIRTAWPANSEERWREFVDRERATAAPSLMNRTVLARFCGDAA
jgi:hypothetical protein